MSQTSRVLSHLPFPEPPLPRTKPAPAPRAIGKFFYVGGTKLYLRGATYGTFQPDSEGNQYGLPDQVEQDFSTMASNGINTVRLYTVPPRWLLDLAALHGLYVMVGIPWEQHIAFLDGRQRRASIERRVREGVRACAGHPAVLCYSIGNEIPASLVRWYGHRRVERFLQRLYRAAKQEDPQSLVTYVNFPTTEYLELPFLDFVSFNVYLETRDRLDAYLARLQNLAGDRPLVMAEVGLDSRGNGLAGQAETLEWQIETAFEGGCAGAFIFAWTDEWYRGGQEVEDWDFGLTARDRAPKPALRAVREAFQRVPFDRTSRQYGVPSGAAVSSTGSPLGRQNVDNELHTAQKLRPSSSAHSGLPTGLPPQRGPRTTWPHISVVVCSHNGARTLRDCCEGLLELDYPSFDAVVVDDGSTDATAGIAEEYGFRVISTPSRGLSSARNTGLEAAVGEIVAYIDDDARPDPHWLYYIADTFLTTDYVGVGGPNVLPAQSGTVAWCVENSPGGPIHVLLNDREAEHIPGCNMAFRKEALLAVGGFDPRYRTAGDDVDICWKLQARGWKLGFNPAAVVWHHRRNSVRAYWRQQVGYGRAEALLEKKWPEKYNAAGHLTWAGRLYGGGLAQTLGPARGRIYNGVWGSAPFQSVYGPPAGTGSLWGRLLALPTMPEWYALIGLLALLTALGFSWTPLLLALPLLLAGMAAPVAQAVLGGARARFPLDIPPGKALRLRTLTFSLHLLQPLARLIGRSAKCGIRNSECGIKTTDDRRPTNDVIPHSAFSPGGAPYIPHSVHSAFGPFRIQKLAVWRESWQSSQEWLEGIEMEIKEGGGRVQRGGSFDDWDLEARGGMLGSGRLLMAIEEHGQGRQMARFRIWPRVEVAGICSLLVFFGLAAGATLSAGYGGLLGYGAPLGEAHLSVAAYCLWAITLVLAARILYECSIGVGTLALGVRAAPGVHVEGDWRGALGAANCKSPRPRPYRLLLAYAAPMWKSWLFILVLTLLSTMFSLLQPWPLKVLVDNVLGGQPLSGLPGQIAAILPGASSPAGLLVWVSACGLMVYLGASGLDALLTYNWVSTGQGMVYRLGRDLFARIQRRSLLFHSRNSVGDSLGRVTTDAWAVHTAADNLLFAPLHAAVTSAAVIAVMLPMNGTLTLLSLMVAPSMVVGGLVFGRRMRAASRTRRRIESRLQSHVQRTMSSISVVQSFTREEHEHRRFKEFTKRSIRAQQRSALIGSLYGLGSGLASALGTALILLVGAHEVQSGRLTVGELLVSVAYLVTLQAQLKTFAGVYRTMQEASGSMERVSEVLNTRDEVTSKPGAIVIADCGLRIADYQPETMTVGNPQSAIRNPQSRGWGISFRDVTFGYEPGRAVLHDLSLEIGAGQTVGIVGATGAGKSTLVGLIARQYDPWQGRVEVHGAPMGVGTEPFRRVLSLRRKDGVPLWGGGLSLRDAELGSVRAAVAVALQEPYLFQGTVAENIKYGKPEATQDEVQAAARAACAHDFIERLPDGYNTVLGERGATLSGGERQRLSIARALIKDAPILVLDEPASALDTETERLLVESLKRLRAGKTTLIISHRLSTVRHAEKIVVIHGGRLVEEGSHDELVQRRGVYSHLYNLQNGPGPPVPEVSSKQ